MAKTYCCLIAPGALCAWQTSLVSLFVYIGNVLHCFILFLSAHFIVKTT